jgi:hypothetical protein
MVGQDFFGFMEMINDPVPKVRQTVAFVYYKLSEFVPHLIFSNDVNLKSFIEKCLAHCDEHQTIANLLVGTLKHLFINSNKLGEGCNQLLNPYFNSIFEKLVGVMYREDIH